MGRWLRWPEERNAPLPLEWLRLPIKVLAAHDKVVTLLQKKRRAAA
jgi:hypothetical protein